MLYFTLEMKTGLYFVFYRVCEREYRIPNDLYKVFRIGCFFSLNHKIKLTIFAFFSISFQSLYYFINLQAL